MEETKNPPPPAPAEYSVCQHCYRHDVALLPIPPGVLLVLKNHGIIDSQPPVACQFCIDDFTKFRNSPTIYMEKFRVEMEVKAKLWRERVNLIKEGQRFMTLEAWADALKKYSQYIETIEKCLGVSFREITAPMFAKHGRHEELNTFAIVLWDIVMLLDRVGSAELQLYAYKFVQVGQTSISRKMLIHSMKKYRRKANNKKLFKQMITDMQTNRGCFIATYVFDNAYADEVMQLRKFRDEVLQGSVLGRIFIYCYYRLSPWLILLIPKNLARARLVRKALRRIAAFLADI
jgi:hypothetical protein